MKLDFPTLDIERSGKFTEANFEIGDPRIIFNILRSKMYSRPIYVICQEIMSNSRDANNEAGRGEKPAEVVLPTYLSDQIHFRDFGLGISPDRMQNVYLRYGNSTKRSDNKQDGGFGLGAKTPFAYSDSFNIVTTTEENGKRVKRTYIAYIDETQKGAVSLVSEVDTEEETGTTISMAVKKQDMKAFAAAVKTIGTFWNPRPIVKSDEPFSFGVVESMAEGTGWAMLQRAPLDTFHNSIVLINGIPYGLRHEAVFPAGHSIHQHKDIDIMKKLVLSSNVLLRFNVGDLAVTANREDLDYQPAVIQKLHERLEVMVNEARAAASEKLKNAPNLLEATMMWRECRELFRHFGIKGQWNKLELLDETIDFYADREMDWKNNKRIFEGKEDTKVSVFMLDTDGSVVMAKRRNYRRTSPIRHIETTRAYKIVEDLAGNEKPDRSRVQTIFDTNPGKFTYVAVVSFKSPEALAWIDKRYNWLLWGVEKLENYPKAPKGPAAKRGSYKIHKVKRFTSGSRAEWVPDSSKTTADTTGGVYVLLESGLIMPGKGMKPITREKLRSIKSCLGVEIYGFLSKWAKKDINPAWKQLADALREKERELLNCPEVSHMVEYGCNNLTTHYLPEDAINGLKASKLPDGIFRKWIENSTLSQKHLKKLSDLNEVRRLLGKPNIEADKGLNSWLHKRCVKNYPMAFYLDRYNLRTAEIKRLVKDVVNYINLVDSKKD
jgi:hypothetical protein